MKYLLAEEKSIYPKNNTISIKKMLKKLRALKWLWDYRMHQYTLDRKIEKKTIVLPNVIEKNENI